jgi:hypothetical protein
MSAELAEVLLLAVRGAVFAGICGGTWLCLGEQPSNNAPLERFATFPVVLVPLLAALGAITYV